MELVTTMFERAETRKRLREINEQQEQERATRVAILLQVELSSGNWSEADKLAYRCSLEYTQKLDTEEALLLGAL